MGVKWVLEETCVKEEWIYSSSVSLVNNKVIFHEVAKFEMIQPLRPHSQNIQTGFEGKSSGNPSMFWGALRWFPMDVPLKQSIKKLSIYELCHSHQWYGGLTKNDGVIKFLEEW